MTQKLLLSGVAAVALSSTSFSAAVAQDADAATDEADQIVVTGSRIPRAEYSSPTPITTLGDRDFTLAGTTNLGQILTQLPGLGSTATSRANNAANNDQGGLDLPDLRRLGTTRTLTLVNGRRHVGGAPGTTTVDLNSIPPQLVERVEVVTGGASAIYGSDAVSGVVNIILKDDYEGVEFDVFGSRPFEGSFAENYSANFLAGGNFADGRANITLAAGWDRQESAVANDLGYNDDFGTIVNPLDTGEDDGIVDRILVPRVLSERIDENGVLNPFGDVSMMQLLGPDAGPITGLVVFDDQGNPVSQTVRENTNSFAFGNFPNGCDFCFELNDYETVAPTSTRLTFNGTASYDLLPSLTAYSEFKYVRTDLSVLGQPSFEFGSIVINVNDNPFLDEGLRQQLLANGQENVSFAKFFAQGGGRDNDIERETYRFVGGFKGDIETGAADFDWDVSYNYGETSNQVRGFRRSIDNNLFEALDAVIDPATGEAACRSQVPSAQPDGFVDNAVTPGCAPLNPFGAQASQEALDFAFTSTLEAQTLTQEVLSGSVLTDSGKFFELPGGPVSVVFGAEWREETSAINGDAFVQAGLTESAAQPDEVGGYDVFEVFGEASLPLLTDMPFIQELTLDAAIRKADYSHAGEATAWKVGGIWSLIDDFRIRGTYSEAVRAPNITEAFRPLTPGFRQVDDPCDADNIDDDPDRAGNCALLGIPEGFQANDNVSIDTTSQGNLGLSPEESTSWTIGGIFQPRWVPGLTLSADWYSIDIEDAILFVVSQTILDNCVDATGGPDPTFCAEVVRDPTTLDVVTVNETFVNASFIETRGVDFTANYVTGVSGLTNRFGVLKAATGDLSLDFTGNYIERLNQFEFQNRPDEINVERGEVGDPLWSFRASADYSQGPVTLGWRGRYVGSQFNIARGPDGDTPEDTSNFEYEDVFYHDVQAQYMMGTSFGEVELYGGINNLLAQTPPGNLQGFGTNNAGNGDETIYDAFGRVGFVGVRARF